MKDKTVLFVLSLSLFSFFTTEIVAEEFLLYDNINKKISIEYPENWIKLGGDIDYTIPEEIQDEITSTNVQNLKVVNFIPPDEISNFNIVIENLPYTMSVEDYYDASQSVLSQVPDWKLLDSVSTTIANLPAIKVLYTFSITDPEQPSVQIKFQTEQILIINEGKAHVLSFVTLPELYDSYQPIVERMFASYNIK